MRYPMWRKNIDGTEFVVRDKSEAYAEPEKIAGFLPNKPIPEQTAPTTEPEAEDGLQDEEVDHQEEVNEDGRDYKWADDPTKWGAPPLRGDAPAKRGPGRPKKGVA